jgi:hypothetical protein
VNFFRMVKERGLDLRFGAATLITTAFFMAPLTALFLVFFYGVLRRRGLDAGLATGLTFVLGFGTPLFFRTSVLNHNMFVMYAMFIAFVWLWVPPGEAVSLRHRVLAGFFAGLTLATDYVGVTVPLLYGYFVLPRAKSASWTWRSANRCRWSRARPPCCSCSTVSGRWQSVLTWSALDAGSEHLRARRHARVHAAVARPRLAESLHPGMGYDVGARAAAGARAGARSGPDPRTATARAPLVAVAGSRSCCSRPPINTRGCSSTADSGTLCLSCRS